MQLKADAPGAAPTMARRMPMSSAYPRPAPRISTSGDPRRVSSYTALVE